MLWPGHCCPVGVPLPTLLALELRIGFAKKNKKTDTANVILLSYHTGAIWALWKAQTETDLGVQEEHWQMMSFRHKGGSAGMGRDGPRPQCRPSPWERRGEREPDPTRRPPSVMHY